MQDEAIASSVSVSLWCPGPVVQKFIWYKIPQLQVKQGRGILRKQAVKLKTMAIFGEKCIYNFILCNSQVMETETYISSQMVQDTTVVPFGVKRQTKCCALSC